MTAVCRNTLEILLKFLELAFSSSSEDRKRLHDIEWEANDNSSSVLGEVEVRADTVIGIVRAFLKKRPDNINELIKTLEISSVYQSNSIVSWLAAEGRNFQEFIGYMAAIESLRVCMIVFLKNIKRNKTKI